MGATPAEPSQQPRRGSLTLKELNEEGKKFFDIVESGNTNAVNDFLKQKYVDVNCTNYMGMNALTIAIKNEDEKMVQALLELKEILPKDAALQAVATGNVDLVTKVMDLMKGKQSETAGSSDSSEYSPDITPLALAAQKGDYKMIRMLMKRGHALEEPHEPTCLCVQCKEKLKEHGSSLSRIRLNTYRAYSNPAYICQISDDPILECFLLDKKITECSLLDKEYKAEYEELGAEVRSFTVELLNKCRDNNEVELLLKHPKGFNFQSQKTDYPRLQLALDNKQKEFVANSMVQQVLTAHWLGEFRSWPRKSLFMKVLHVCFRFFFLFFICLALVIAPFSPCLKKFHSPVNRFLMSLASYLGFLTCVFFLNIEATGNYVIGAPQTGFEASVVIFVLGHIWSTIRQFWVEGYRRFFRAPWNWYDMCMQLLFVFTFIFWAESGLDAQAADAKKGGGERKTWGAYDATLVHEGLFAIASVLAAGKLAYYCLQSSRLGPLQVSMGKMAVQIGLFLVFCFLLINAFAIPLTRMYAYYDGMKQTPSDKDSAAQASTFTSFSNSFTTLFWGMFGMSPAEAADIVVESPPGGGKNSHDFTQGVGRMLYATYELLMIIALVNTLIAILSNTFQRVVDNADVEFKFHRTKLWMHFFDESTLVPSPYNLIPSATFYTNAIYYFKAMSKKIKGVKAKFSWQRCCYIERHMDVADEEVYGDLMSKLVQRYFSSETNGDDQEASRK